MKVFRHEHRIGSDECSINARDLQNQSHEYYKMFNFYPTNVEQCDTEVKKLQDFSFENNTVIRDGYGYANACVVDNDSKIRNGGQITNERFKTQLDSRVFKAVPSLNRGGLVPALESRLVQGEDTAQKRSCNVLSEVSTQQYVFLPMIDCLRDNVQNPTNIVPSWTWGGEPTRDVVRQQKFLEEQGYVFDGVAWRKKMC
jgi:hypothetical protein